MTPPPNRPRPAFGAATVQAQRKGGLTRVLTWVVLAVVVGGGAWLGYQLWQQGHQRVRDEVYEPEHPVGLADVDLAEVHHELWADWAHALILRYRGRNAQGRIAAATEALRTAIADTY